MRPFIRPVFTRAGGQPRTDRQHRGHRVLPIAHRRRQLV